MNKLSASVCLGAVLAATCAFAAESNFKFTFDASATKPGFQFVVPEVAFTPEQGFGFDLGSKAEAGNSCVTGVRPFFFSVTAPAGNYDVSITFGDAHIAGLSFQFPL